MDIQPQLELELYGPETEVDVDRLVDPVHNGEGGYDALGRRAGYIQYIGKAKKQNDGTFRCLANVNGALCVVEVRIKMKAP